MKTLLIRSTILFGLTTCVSVCHALPALSMPYSSTIAQADPDYQQEVLNNTVCSFIVTQDVDGAVRVRQSPSTNAAAIATLKRGDGVRAVGRKGSWVNLAARTQGTAPNETFVPLQGWVYNQFINGCSEDQFDRWRK